MDNTSPEQPPRRTPVNRLLSRRDFLKLAGPTGVAATLAACGSPPDKSPPPAPPPPPTPSSPPKPTQPATAETPQSIEITGLMKNDVAFRYSEFIQTHELIPTVFSDYDNPETRLKMTIDYLRRYREALKENPTKRDQPLSTLHINTPEDNYPISIPARPDDPANNWTVYDVVNTLLTEIENGKTITTYNPDEAAKLGNLAGTLNDYELQDSQWVRKTTIKFGALLSKKGSFFEQKPYFYTSLTDVDTAVALVHEYAHALQDEMFLAFLQKDSGALTLTGTNPQEVKNWIGREVKKASERLNVSLLPPESDVKFHEAQANAVGFSFLYSLNELNSSSHFPGTGRADPTEENVKAIIEQNPGIRFINLYRLFLEEVIAQKNALSPRWLLDAGK